MQEPILLQTLKGKATSRPPVWFMRQAGRVLPSYLKIKEKYTFWQMMQNPKVAAEVTLLPVRDLGVDAAILFSDILVIPYAMGMGLDFTDAGPVFEKPLAQRDNPLESLNPDPSKLDYIYNVIDEIIKTRPANIPLIGFCGAPLTVLLFMLQGLGRKGDFPDAVKFIYQNPEATKKLVDAITGLSIIYAKEQIKHGTEVFQLFDTHAGLLPFELYKKLFLPATKQIATAVREENIPFIFFPKGLGTGIAEITPEHCDFLSIDWQTSLPAARKLVHPQIGLQGNIDPRLLFAEQNEIKNTLNSYLEFGSKNQNWIFNLGHGFIPGLPYDNAKFLANWVKTADWKQNT
ncbi:uroporphyrinogen decarboxylase [Mariniphaga anaerophila]|uniref:Uroporphyrinogen decarboxylase n=1 Tax=Mariniphaga anaerophila TaxID=1484053 RepID=A0A1M5EJD3_9BACT|nr:uroporphyrinogen decarboxylase [Mariniphaga anaerophila]SHF79172.1 uroporphyrinogen decarboxylase [Mariniphaga anaerophila]